MNKIIKQYTQPAFVICFVALSAMAYLIAAVQSEEGLKIPFIDERVKFNFVKEPIKPNKPLSLLDESKLKPFKVIEKHQIDNKDVIESLGTEEYIQWTLREAVEGESDTRKDITVFITYYEKPDSVPHVPEECYTGGGYQKSKSETITFKVEDVNNQGRFREIPGRIVTFTRPASSYFQNSFPVLYFFNVNGKYVNTRTEARIELGKNLIGKHSYFSKVEFVFNKTKVHDDEKTIQMSEKVLAVMLPVLEDEHWPTREQLRGIK